MYRFGGLGMSLYAVIARVSGVLSAGLLGLAAPAASGQPLLEKAKLVAGDGAAGDLFGSDVSVSGDRMAVGAYLDDDNGDASGSVYVFERQTGTWNQHQKLLPTDGVTEDFFGFSVALSGDWLVAGAYWDDDKGQNSGSAYVFRRQQNGMWQQSQKLLANDGAAFDVFGYDVAIAGERLVVGAHYDENQTGAAYVFELDGAGVWQFAGKLIADDAQPGDRFGFSVSISGDRIVAGAPRHDGVGVDSGSAYVFERQCNPMCAWTQVAKLTASDEASGDRFGRAVSISGDHVAAGAFLNDIGATNSGSAYVFEWSGVVWNETCLLTASDPVVDDRFGLSIEIAGDRLLVGAGSHDHNGAINTGAAYLFQRDSAGGCDWHQVAELVASDGLAGDFLGNVAISETQAVVGAHDVDVQSSQQQGVVYVFDACGGSSDVYGSGCAGPSSPVPSAAMAGCVAPGGTVTLSLWDGAPTQQAFLFLGSVEVALPMGAGCTMNVFPFVGPLPLGNLSPTGELALTVMLPTSILPSTLTMQGFILDPAAPLGFSTTNGVKMRIEPCP